MPRGPLDSPEYRRARKALKESGPWICAWHGTRYGKCEASWIPTNDWIAAVYPAYAHRPHHHPLSWSADHEVPLQVQAVLHPGYYDHQRLVPAHLGCNARRRHILAIEALTGEAQQEPTPPAPEPREFTDRTSRDW